MIEYQGLMKKNILHYSLTILLLLTSLVLGIWTWMAYNASQPLIEQLLR